MGSEITDILSGFRDNVTVQWFLATRQQWLEPRSVYSVEYLIPSINTPASLLSLLGSAEMYIHYSGHTTAPPLLLKQSNKRARPAASAEPLERLELPITNTKYSQILYFTFTQSHLRGLSFESLKLRPLTSPCVHPKIFLSTTIHCQFKCSNTAFH